MENILNEKVCGIQADQLLFTAQVINEYFQELDDDHDLKAFRRQHGMAHTRDKISELAVSCEQVYNMVKDELDYDEPFDCDFVPMFMEECVLHTEFIVFGDELESSTKYLFGLLKRHHLNHLA